MDPPSDSGHGGRAKLESFRREKRRSGNQGVNQGKSIFSQDTSGKSSRAMRPKAREGRQRLQKLSQKLRPVADVISGAIQRPIVAAGTIVVVRLTSDLPAAPLAPESCAGLGLLLKEICDLFVTKNASLEYGPNCLLVGAFLDALGCDVSHAMPVALEILNRSNVWSGIECAVGVATGPSGFGSFGGQKRRFLAAVGGAAFRAADLCWATPPACVTIDSDTWNYFRPYTTAAADHLLGNSPGWVRTDSGYRLRLG